MAISTESIIHYTDTLDKLTSILDEGFRIKYCSEAIRLTSLNRGSQAAHPMLSFCDIPLSDSIQHFDAYGKYGIGLSKKWAISKGINPVLYLDNKSLFAESLYKLLKERRSESSNLTEEQKKLILEIKSYTKNYSGPLKTKKVNTDDYRFYDEREWRLVPKSEEINGAPFSINLNAYSKNKDKYNGLISACRFKFEAKDISYIIVSKTDEIPKIIKFLRSVYDDRCTSNELDILFSKICSTEQIIADY